MGKLLRMAWRNMWRNWRRTAIALVAIVLGLILLLFMDGLIKGSDQAIFGNAVRLYGGNVQVHAPGFREKANRLPLLPLEEADAVVQASLRQPQVVAAAKRIHTAGIVSSREGAYPVAITGIEPTVEAPLSLQAENIAEGRFLLDGEGDAVVIGRGLADLLAVGVGDRVTLLGRSKNETMRQRTMTIVGIYDLGMADAEKGMAFITLGEPGQNKARTDGLSLARTAQETSRPAGRLTTIGSANRSSPIWVGLWRVPQGSSSNRTVNCF